MTFKTISTPQIKSRWYHCTACRYRWEALALQPCGKCASSEVYDLTHIPASTFDENRFIGHVEYTFNQGASMVKNHGVPTAEVVGMGDRGVCIVKAKAGAPKEAFKPDVAVAIDDWGRIVPSMTSLTQTVGYFHRYIQGTVPTHKPTAEEMARAAKMQAQAQEIANRELEAVRKRQREEVKIKAKLFVGEELDEIIAKLEGRGD